MRVSEATNKTSTPDEAVEIWMEKKRNRNHQCVKCRRRSRIRNRKEEVAEQVVKEGLRQEESMEGEQAEMRGRKSRRMLRILRYQVQKVEEESGMKIKEDGESDFLEHLNQLGAKMTRDQREGLGQGK